MISLTAGAVERMQNGEKLDNPVLQVKRFKERRRSGESYCKVKLSDGIKRSQWIMLAQELDSSIVSNSLCKYTICRINKYSISVADDDDDEGPPKNVIKLINFTVLKHGSEVGRSMKYPQDLDTVTEEDPDVSTPTLSFTASASLTQTGSTTNNGPSLGESVDITPNDARSFDNNHNGWIIKVRVTNKSSTGSWRQEKDKFSMEFVDDSGKKGSAFFKDEAKKLFPIIEVDKLYYISGFSLNQTKKMFSIATNNLQIILTKESEIIPCEDDDDTASFNLTQLSALEDQLTANDGVDSRISMGEITPIRDLRPSGNSWIVKVRVWCKSDLNAWSNSRGSGVFFSMNLADASDAIRCTAFRDEAQKFFPIFEVGKLYYISGWNLPPANKKFSTLDNDFEMILTRDSKIIPCQDDDDTIPMI